MGTLGAASTCLSLWALAQSAAAVRQPHSSQRIRAQSTAAARRLLSLLTYYCFTNLVGLFVELKMLLTLPIKAVVNFLLRLPPTISFVGLVIAVTPLLSLPSLTGTGYHDGQRILLITCLLGGVLITSARIWRAKLTSSTSLIVLPVSKLVLLLLAVFMGLGFVSSIRAHSVQFALYEWATFALLLVLASAIAVEFSEKRLATIRIFAVLGTVSCGLYVFNTLTAYVASVRLGIQLPPNQLIIGFDNYRFLNHIQTTTLPLLTLLTLRTDPTESSAFRYRHGLKILLVLWWMLLFATGGRGTFVSLLVACLVALVFFRQHAITWCRHMTVGAVAGFFATLLLYKYIPLHFGLQPFGLLGNLAARTIENVDGGRLPLWRLAFGMTIEHPWMGFGPLHFAHEGRFQQIAAHPHNWALQISSEWGIPALLCCCGLIFCGLQRLITTAKSPNESRCDESIVWVALLTTGVAIVIDGLVSGLIVMPVSQLWIVLYLSFAWGWTEVLKKPTHVNPNRLGGLICGISTATLFLLSTMAVYGLWPAVLDLPKHEKNNQQYQTSQTDGHLSPRIWRHGFFE